MQNVQLKTHVEKREEDRAKILLALSSSPLKDANGLKSSIKAKTLSKITGIPLSMISQSIMPELIEENLVCAIRRDNYSQRAGMDYAITQHGLAFIESIPKSDIELQSSRHRELSLYRARTDYVHKRIESILAKTSKRPLSASEMLQEAQKVFTEQKAKDIVERAYERFSRSDRYVPYVIDCTMDMIERFPFLDLMKAGCVEKRRIRSRKTLSTYELHYWTPALTE